MTWGNASGSPICRYCGAELVWHGGNGGQWLGAHPPHDWATCGGVAGTAAIKHAVTLPPTNSTRDDLERWLDA